MSVHDLGGGRWQVRWRENGRQQGRNFDDRSEAELIDMEIRLALKHGQPASLPRRRRGGGDSAPHVGLRIQEPTLNEYFFKPLGATPSFYFRRQRPLAISTQKLEEAYWDNHIVSTLGDEVLGEIKTVMVEDWLDELKSNGVGDASVVRTFKLLSKVLADAVGRGVITFNPAAGARSPKVRPKLAQPLEPSEVEKIALQLRGVDRLMVRMLGYTGVRPGELLGTGESEGVRWKDLRTTDAGRMTLHVLSGKTKQVREVQIFTPVKDLLEKRRQELQPADSDLVIPPPTGGSWNDNKYRNWRTRKWTPACQRAGFTNRRPYDLRHGFSSLLIHEGRDFAYVADQLGNSVAVAQKTYSHVKNRVGNEKVTAENAIKRALGSTAERRTKQTPKPRRSSSSRSSKGNTRPVVRRG